MVGRSGHDIVLLTDALKYLDRAGVMSSEALSISAELCISVSLLLYLTVVITAALHGAVHLCLGVCSSAMTDRPSASNYFIQAMGHTLC